MTYVLCLYVFDSRAPLHRFHVYRAAAPRGLPELRAAGDPDNMLRIVDEHGADHLYPAHWFVPVELPAASEQAFLTAIVPLVLARVEQLEEWAAGCEPRAASRKEKLP